jgi:hypothetical protein
MEFWASIPADIWHKYSQEIFRKPINKAKAATVSSYKITEILVK